MPLGALPSSRACPPFATPQSLTTYWSYFSLRVAIALPRPAVTFGPSCEGGTVSQCISNYWAPLRAPFFIQPINQAPSCRLVAVR
jgi:hypothetical protein